MLQESQEIIRACNRMMTALMQGQRLDDSEAEVVMIKLMIVFAALMDEDARKPKHQPADVVPAPVGEG